MNQFLDKTGALYLITKIKALLLKKVDAVEGKGLSANDFTNTYKSKLDRVEEGANNYQLPTAGNTLGGVKTTSSVSSASGYTPTPIIDGVPYYKDTNTTYEVFKSASASAAGSTGLVPSPAAGKQSQYLRGDGTWATPTNTTYSDVTQSTHGLMTAADKKKLDAFGSADTYALKSDITSMFDYKGSVDTASALPTSGQKKGDTYNIVAASDYGPAGTNVTWDGSAWDPLGGAFTIDTISNAEIDAMFS